MDGFLSGRGIANGRGKLPRFTQACGNKRFTASDDSGAWGDTKGGPTQPEKLADGPLRASKGPISLSAGLD